MIDLFSGQENSAKNTLLWSTKTPSKWKRIIIIGCIFSAFQHSKKFSILNFTLKDILSKREKSPSNRCAIVQEKRTKLKKFSPDHQSPTGWLQKSSLSEFGVEVPRHHQPLPETQEIQSLSVTHDAPLAFPTNTLPPVCGSYLIPNPIILKPKLKGDKPEVSRKTSSLPGKSTVGAAEPTIRISISQSK